MPRDLRTLINLYQTDPGSLTPAELRFVRKELERIAGQAGSAYEENRRRSARVSRQISEEGRDISACLNDGTPPEWAACDFRRWCEYYLSATFDLAWSSDHLKVIARIEDAVLRGGLFALAMPRGSGKTVLTTAACLWAVLNGLRSFVALIGASEAAAEEMLEAIKRELETNDRLHEHYSLVTGPARALDGIASRSKGQICRGKHTHICWTDRALVLPFVEGSPAAGAVIKATGITGRIRGLSFKRADGRTARPDLVAIDDPQTDEAARSPSQCAERERVLMGAILGLAGPGKKISGIMPLTVIRPGDMADTVLDRDKHPEWQGERMKLVYKFPEATQLWERYAQFRADSLKAGGKGEEATAFYAANRAEMDAGAVVAWPDRYDSDEISAVQNAMNLKLRSEVTFWSEHQNEPLPEDYGGLEELTVEQVASRTNRLRKGEVPLSATRLTAFIDIQEKLLYYTVCAWGDDFTGSVIDYGSYPDQQRAYYTLRDARRTLRMATPGAGLEGAIFAGLGRLADLILGREWRRDDGAMLRVERCLIDANWGASTDTVYLFCRQSPHAANLTPFHGKGITAGMQPFSEYKPKPGDRCGLNWRILAAQGRRTIRRCLADVNFWKSFVHARLSTAMGDRGALSIYGEKSDAHRLFAEQICSEYRVRTEGRGRTVDEWHVRPNQPDNHFLDCLTGCAVAASIQGSVLPEAGGGPPPKRVKVKFSDLQRRKREGR